MAEEKVVVNLAPETCAYCSGCGKDFGKLCGSCGGQGSVLVAQPARKCAACSGCGKDFGKPCPACKGAGWAHVRT